jgi:carbon storage regulator
VLILQRAAGQSIMIGDIEVTVTRISGGKVSLGINAPSEIPIVRLEVAKRLEVSPG